MNDFLSGGIAVGSFIAGLFFLRYWRITQDRFFLLFAVSFWLEASSRVAMQLLDSWSDEAPARFLVRLIAYGLILFAIWDKNRGHRG